jgi:hypothetical protein
LQERLLDEVLGGFHAMHLWRVVRKAVHAAAVVVEQPAEGVRLLVEHGNKDAGGKRMVWLCGSSGTAMCGCAAAEIVVLLVAA